MGLFDLFDVMKQSARKRRKTEKYRKSAKEYIQGGKSLYNKAYADIVFHVKETNDRIVQHYHYKQHLLWEISQDVKQVLHQCTNFYIDRRVLETPRFSSSLVDSYSGRGVIAVFSATIVPSYSVPSVLSLHSNSNEEYEKAKRQRNKSKKFYEEMILKRERFHHAKENMKEISSFIYVERKLLDRIITKVKQITAQFNSSIKKSSFSRLEAEYLKVIHKIAETINELLTTKFLTDTMRVSGQYEDVFEKIKIIHKALKKAPSTIRRKDIEKIIKPPATNHKWYVVSSKAKGRF
ncbi:hypothetical protein [Bacillus sp. EB600]|uniref:hypothetical protein n=1 Tax=Bacillus sp. EB600 TaxID=2806345 RepID=UPI0021089E8E|nr:hypothetical protein [Bacillus sp. EB600]MCQ6278537.1 hypothetical protein [Bacillus sp. EB600]